LRVPDDLQHRSPVRERLEGGNLPALEIRPHRLSAPERARLASECDGAPSAGPSGKLHLAQRPKVEGTQVTLPYAGEDEHPTVSDGVTSARATISVSGE